LNDAAASSGRAPHAFRASLALAPAVAAIVGFGGTVAVVLSAAEAIGATPAQSASWLAAMCLAVALTSGGLSLRHRMPIVTAWSTPGAALLATSQGVDVPHAVGAFLVAGALIVLTGLVRPLGALVARIPAPVAAAMLAGVLVKFVLAGFAAAAASPALVLPLIGLFLLARAFNPFAAVILVVIAGFLLADLLGETAPIPPFALAGLVLTPPAFGVEALVGVALPLYIVTMASQNLPGFAVLKAHGYPPPVRSSLAATGLASMAVAPFGSHTVNMSAITAAICMGPDVHPDPARRWPAGLFYMLWYVLLAAFAGSFIALFAAMPRALIEIVAGLALIGSLAGALSQAMAEERQRFAACLAFGVAASGVGLLGVGAAFWGLVAGVVALGVDRLAARFRPTG
jgi:benzoate membrane transport protein